MYQEFIQNEYRDAKMDINLLSQYQLSIKVSDTGIVFFVNDANDYKCLAIEKYKFPSIATPESITISLQNIWDSHPFLNAGYWKNVIVLFSHLKFAYVPIPLTENNIAPEAFSHFNFRLAAQEQMRSYRIQALGSDCYFGVNQEVIDWLSGFYPSMVTKLGHASFAFLKGLQQLNVAANQVCLYLSDDIVTIANLNEGTLGYINSFQYQSEEDILYNCTLVIDELQINRKEVSITMWGDTEKSTTILEKLKLYYPIVQQGERPAHLTFSFEFDELEENNYFDLFYSTHLFV